MGRFEVRAARALGVALPLAETLRRRTDFSDPPAYLDDFIAGALLLIGAWAVRRGRRHGPALLAGAWGVVCGGGYYSFFGQLRQLDRPDISGLPGLAVVAIKGAMLILALAALACAIRGAARPEPRA